MGYRTVVEFNNDVLGNREEFIAKASNLYDAIISNGRDKANGVSVLEQVHNDQVSLMIVDGSGVRQVVASCHWSAPSRYKTLLNDLKLFIKSPH